MRLKAGSWEHRSIITVIIGFVATLILQMLRFSGQKGRRSPLAVILKSFDPRSAKMSAFAIAVGGKADMAP